MNSLWNLIILAIAIIIPGGLIVYFAWKACKHHNRKKMHRNALKDFKALYPLEHETYAYTGSTDAKLREWRKSN